MVDNYNFLDFLERLLLQTDEGIDFAKYNRVCEGAYREFKGSDICGYNLAQSFVLAFD